MPALNKFRANLFAPLFLPGLQRSLNLALLYERQVKLKEAKEDEVFDEDETADDGGKLARIAARNDAHVRIISLLLDFAGNNASFMFSDFWQQIKNHKHIGEMTAQRLLFLDMLKLYEIREIDLQAWRGENIRYVESMGEFDLDYCLTRCLDKDKTLQKVERITVDKNGERITCEINAQEKVYMDDLSFEVSLK